MGKIDNMKESSVEKKGVRNKGKKEGSRMVK